MSQTSQSRWPILIYWGQKVLTIVLRSPGRKGKDVGRGRGTEVEPSGYLCGSLRFANRAATEVEPSWNGEGGPETELEPRCSRVGAGRRLRLIRAGTELGLSGDRAGTEGVPNRAGTGLEPGGDRAGGELEAS